MKLSRILAFFALLCAASLSFGQGQNFPGFVIVTSAPAGACTSGTAAQMVASTGAIYTCQSNTWAQVSGGGSSFPVTSAQTVNSGGSIVPSGTGQISANVTPFVFAPGCAFPATPSATASISGGTIATAQNVYIRVTYVGLSCVASSGELLIQLNSTTGCGSGSACSITVTMPPTCVSGSLPAGVTGCTVWDDAGTLGKEKQQAASNNCVNITTTTCTIGTLAAGSNLSAALTLPSGVAPSNPQTANIPDLIIPSGWYGGGNGNSYPAWGIDSSALNGLACCITTSTLTAPTKQPLTPGVFTFLSNFFINDDINPPPISNTLVSIKHESGASTSTGTSPGASVDDRALAIRIDNDLTTNPNYEQYLGQYNETFADNNAMTCGPISSGLPWGESCVAGVRALGADQRTAGANALTFEGIAGIAQSSAGSVSSGTTIAFAGVKGGAFSAVSSAMGANGYAGGFFGASNTGGGTGGSGYGVYIKAPTGRFNNPIANVGLFTEQFGNNNGDWNIFSQSTATGNGHNYFGGPILFSQPFFGSVVPSQLATQTGSLSASLNSCSGATTWSYKLVPKDMAGGFAPASATITTGAAGCATLTGSNFVQLVSTSSAYSLASGETYGKYSFDVYRTVAGGTPSTTGYIGNMPCNVAGGCTFNDTGLAVVIPPNDDPTTPPSYNTSGRNAGFTQGDLNTCQAVGTAASPSVASCSAATAGFVSCATNASGASCQVNTTAVTAHSQIELTQRTDTNAGTILAVTCNTTLDSAVKNAISAVSPGVSFTFNVGTIATNPECFSFTIRN